jgi:2-polyprenyl-6-methoxyphenol hydroxylase-like FAD-dependent oxidoreductase
MPGVEQVLIVGGGLSGMSLAICLRQAGVAAEIVDTNPTWGTYGAGISLTAPALRALNQLGVLDQIEREGFCSDGTTVCDQNGRTLFAAPTHRILGGGIPNAGGIMRPVLHRILARRTTSAGTNVRLGVTVSRFTQTGDGVNVTFSDGSMGRYDLVVGADGVNSDMRKRIFPHAAAPKFTGQGCWRAVAPRPSEIGGTHVYLGGPVKVGVNPVSRTEIYMFVLQHVPDNPWIPETELHKPLARLLESFGGTVAKVRDGLGPQSRVVYRPLEKLLLPAPWHLGRVVLIGDAAHATTPHLAAGAGIGFEDALVLAEEVSGNGDIETALARFTRRRFERCRMVVENSALLGELEMQAAPIERQAALSRESAAALALPY